MEFSFENTSLPESKPNSDKPSVLKPGIYAVFTDKLEAGLSDKNSSPYIDWTVKEPVTGHIVTQRYFVSTKVNEGKKMSAWDVTSSAFLQLVMAATNTDKDTAKAKLSSVVSSISSHEQLATKLSSLVIGKQFNIKINGKEVLNSESKKFIRSEFGNYTFAESVGATPSRLGKPYVKTLNTTETATTAAPVNDLW